MEMAEAFVRTIKRDYVRVSPCPDAQTVMHQLSASSSQLTEARDRVGSFGGYTIISPEFGRSTATKGRASCSYVTAPRSTALHGRCDLAIGSVYWKISGRRQQYEYEQQVIRRPRSGYRVWHRLSSCTLRIHNALVKRCRAAPSVYVLVLANPVLWHDKGSVQRGGTTFFDRPQHETKIRSLL